MSASSSRKMAKMTVLALVCSLSAVRADGPIDENSVTAMFKKEQEQMQEKIAKLENKMMAKDESIAMLTTALQSKTEHRQLQLTANGEVMQLVREADLKELASRVAACEQTNADQDAKLSMTMDSLTKVMKMVSPYQAAGCLTPRLPYSREAYTLWMGNVLTVAIPIRWPMGVRHNVTTTAVHGGLKTYSLKTLVQEVVTALSVLQQQCTHPSLLLAVAAALWTEVLATLSAQTAHAQSTHTTSARRCALLLANSSAVMTKFSPRSLPARAARTITCTSGQTHRARRRHCRPLRLHWRPLGPRRPL